MRISGRGISRPGRRSEATRPGIARAFAKADLIVAGSDVFQGGLPRLRSRPGRHHPASRTGRRPLKGELLAEITGRLASILTAERVALNLFQRMCGIATLTRRYVDRVSGMPVKILDTRKTAPRPSDSRQVLRPRGRRIQPPVCPLRRRPDQGQPHRGGATGIGEAVRRVRGRIPTP